MTVTAAEFKSNFGKYLTMVSEEDVFITSDGKIIAKVTDPKISAVDSIRGILKNVSDDIDAKA